MSLYQLLYALAFAALLAGVVLLVVDLLDRPERPHDRELEWPEFSHPKDAHVRVVRRRR